MARFDDQFVRHEPLTLKFNSPGDTWPRRIAFEAQAILTPAARREINRIAHFLDLIVGQRASQSTATYRSSARPNPEIQRKLEQQRMQMARTLHGDVHLLGAGGGTEEVLEHLRKLSDEFTAADLYGVLSLWKLVDYVDLKDRRRSSTSAHGHFFWARAEDVTLHGAMASIKARLLEETLAEAAYAAATAWQLRESALRQSGQATAADTANRERERALVALEQKARQAAEELERQRSAAREKRQAAAKVGAAHRWSSLDDHKAEALELARGGTFRSRAAAARFAADRISKDEHGNQYTTAAVEGWLKQAGWKPAK